MCVCVSVSVSLSVSVSVCVSVCVCVCIVGRENVATSDFVLFPTLGFNVYRV